MWYLIVSIPDLCTITYFYCRRVCGVGKGVGKNSARDFDIYLLASNVGLSLCQSVHIVHARASSLCVSTLWVRQAITSSLFQSSTILMLDLFIKYYEGHFLCS